MKNGMKMAYPAAKWQDAIPCGNGAVGAMVYGNIERDIILVNHEELYFHRRHKDVSTFDDYLPEMRALLLDGKYAEAVAFMREKCREYMLPDRSVSPYCPFMDLIVSMNCKDPFSDYSRSLSFETGECEVAWKEKEISYSRKLFVSRADNAIIMKISSDHPDGVSADIGLSMRDKVLNPTDVTVPNAVSIAKDDQWITFRAYGMDGTKYGALLRVVAKNGAVSHFDDVISVKNADEIVLICKLYIHEEFECAIPRLKEEILALGADYHVLLEKHIAVHRPLYFSANVEIAHQTTDKSNEELLLEAYKGIIPGELMHRMQQFGRYLLITSAGKLPPNLQGIWNGDYSPEWDSDFHNDENIQMNYWAALPYNMKETVLSYVNLYESHMEAYRENARKVFHCRGIYIPLAETIDGHTYHDGMWNCWISAAGWLAQLFYDYYLYTQDKVFLKEHVAPFLKEIMLFYEDYLFEKDGKYVIAPSLSPENYPMPKNEHSSMVCINATMDIAILKEVIHNICNTYTELELEPQSVARWQEMLTKLPAYDVNEDGAFREWLYPGLLENYHQRHESHIYPLFPGFEITEENNPKLFHAIEVAVEKRLCIGMNSQTGWSYAHLANIYARLGQGDRALECIELMSRSCLGTNLLTYHNDWRGQGLTLNWFGSRTVYQIDAAFGVTAAVIEMLLFSGDRMVKLLPALPSRWKEGKADRLQCRGGIEVSMQWNISEQSKHFSASMIAVKEQSFDLKLPFVPKKLSVEGGKYTACSYGAQYITLTVEKGKTVTLSME